MCLVQAECKDVCQLLYKATCNLPCGVVVILPCRGMNKFHVPCSIAIWRAPTRMHTVEMAMNIKGMGLFFTVIALIYHWCP